MSIRQKTPLETWKAQPPSEDLKHRIRCACLFPLTVSFPQPLPCFSGSPTCESWVLRRRGPSAKIRELESLKEKAMAPHSSPLAWKIPWAEEPGGLPSMGSLRVRYNWATSLSLFTFMHWRRNWQPALVFSPGESQGRGNLVGCRLRGRTESDTTEAT